MCGGIRRQPSNNANMLRVLHNVKALTFAEGTPDDAIWTVDTQELLSVASPDDGDISVN